jgi:cystathionine beta-lyase/cystathionine gamma-synthase
MADTRKSYTDDTLCVHSRADHTHGALALPIHLSSTYRFANTAEAAALARGELQRYIYSRYENPTVNEVEAKLAALERGERALLFASGSAAVSTWSYALLRSGDRLVASTELYGGTAHFFEHYLSAVGVAVERVSFHDLSRLDRALTGARACWFETPNNPTVRVLDGRAIASLCRKHGVLCAIDNTFATPILQKPIEWGVDWVMHSATKYLGGHTDLIGGALVAAAGADHRRVYDARKVLGGVIDPHAAFLINRGMMTLSVRIERQCATAESLAMWAQAHPKIAKVHYPGLAAHPGHEVAKVQMRAFGAVLSLDIAGGYSAAELFIDRLKLVVNAASLGGPESLVSMPVLTSHTKASAAERAEAGVTDGTVRLSVGLESFDDLREDISQALEAV